MRSPGDYLGIGAGAHGKLSRFDGEQLSILRTQKHRQPKGYLLSESRLANSAQIDAQDRPFEFMLNALRLNAGLPISRFIQTTGLSEDSIQERVAKAIGQGLLEDRPGWLQPTEAGRLFLNDLLTLFME